MGSAGASVRWRWILHKWWRTAPSDAKPTSMSHGSFHGEGSLLHLASVYPTKSLFSLNFKHLHMVKNMPNNMPLILFLNKWRKPSTVGKEPNSTIKSFAQRFIRFKISWWFSFFFHIRTWEILAQFTRKPLSMPIKLIKITFILHYWYHKIILFLKRTISFSVWDNSETA